MFEVENPTQIREQTYLMADLQLGYWLFRNPRGRYLTGLAPVAELHYTGAFDNESIAGVNAAGSVTDLVYGNTDQLNLTLGMQSYFGRNCSAGLAVVAPLRESEGLNANGETPTDRSFDWAVMLQFNYFFGR